MKQTSYITQKELLPLYAVIFLGFLGYALTITLFIPMLMDRNFDILPSLYTTSHRAIISGFLLAMYPLGQFIGSPIIGKLSDYYGRKKVLMISLILCLLGFIGMALSIQYESIILLFVFCLLTGLCESNMAIAQSIIADNCKDSAMKTKLIGYAYSACSLGYIVGPLVGGIGAANYGYSSPFWITSIGVALLIVWIFARAKHSNYSLNSSTKSLTGPIKLIETITAFKSIFDNPKLYRIYFINFLIFFSVQGLYRVIPLYVIDKWNPTLHTYSILISFVSAMCFLANLFIIGYLAKKFSTTTLLGLLLIFSAIAVFAIVIPSSFSWIWLTYGLAVIPTVMALTTCTTWLSNKVSSAQQGQVLGNNQALLVLGEATSAAIGGLIAAINVPLPVICMGVILFIASIMAYKEKKRNLESEQPVPDLS